MTANSPAFDWFAFALEILAVFLGVLGAFELDNLRDRRAENKERKRILKLIHRELKANHDIIDAANLTKAGQVLNTRTMRNIWEGIASKLSVLSNDDLLGEVTLTYFDIANADRNFDMYDEYARRYQQAVTSEKAAMKPELERECAHFKRYATKIVLPQIVKVLKLIDDELAGKLPKTEHVPPRNGGKRVP